MWLRGPFLHNGSVLNLRELLEPASKRSRTFVRGCDIYDQANLGFVCSGGENFLYDTSLPGNGNAGHEYGTALSGGEKQALMEFLKTI